MFEAVSHVDEASVGVVIPGLSIAYLKPKTTKGDYLIKFSILAFIGLFAASAHVQSNYEKIKALYDAAKAPASAQAIIAKIPSIKACAQFDQNSNSRTNGLIVVKYTVPSVGPEVPAVNYTGVGFKDSDKNVRKFFETYQENLNVQGLNISYKYSITEEECWTKKNSYTGGEKEVCSDQVIYDTDTNASLRLSPKYILYSVDQQYGYCWF